VLGGWLTENYSWRWVFYINLPLGVVSLLGLWLFFPQRRPAAPPRFDFLGFFAVAIGVGALQLLLDRGQSNDWFGSIETWVELVVALVCLYIFIIHTLTADHPLFDRSLYRDRNLIGVTAAAFIIMGVLFAVLALVPPMLQNLYGYPVMTVGLISAPRGVGLFLTMFLVGRLVNRVDPRLLIAIGVCLSAHSLWVMSHFTLRMDSLPFLLTGFEQGLASGFIFVPLSALAFSTLPDRLRIQGTTLYNFVRNIGSSVGISLIQTMFSQSIQRVHAGLAGNIRDDNPALRHWLGDIPVHSAAAAAKLQGLITQQAVMIAYLNMFWLMAGVMVLLIPVLWLVQRPRPHAPAAPVEVETA
jgi:DHA2 family multidrug resistance protein